MAEADLIAIRALIASHRQAALAVLSDGAPLTAMVAYAEEPDCSGVLLLLSGLSAHKRALIVEPACSLLICEPDDGVGDVMTRQRVALQGRAALIARDDPGYAQARATYLIKLPDAEMLFGLGDFDLLRIRPTAARYVAGFGRALTLDPWPFSAAER
jgi:putative heme iron utilization protein